MGNPQKQGQNVNQQGHFPQQNLSPFAANNAGYTPPPPQTQYPSSAYNTSLLHEQSNYVGLQQQTMPAMAPQPTTIGGSVQPPQIHYPNPINAPQLTPWTTELFDCMQDPTNALTTAFFPCVTFGQIAEILNKGHTTCVTMAIMYAAIPCSMTRGYRTKLRRQFGLVEAPAPDWMTHFFCQWCALCQEYRELNNRGLNPALGWHAIVNKNLPMQQSPIAPPTAQTMK